MEKANIGQKRPVFVKIKIKGGTVPAHLQQSVRKQIMEILDLTTLKELSNLPPGVRIQCPIQGIFRHRGFYAHQLSPNRGR